jgi:hypothetical protein
MPVHDHIPLNNWYTIPKHHSIRDLPTLPANIATIDLHRLWRKLLVEFHSYGMIRKLKCDGMVFASFFAPLKK